MLEPKASYQETYDSFVWDIPDLYNMGVDVCDKWAKTAPGRIAIEEVLSDGSVRAVTFDTMRAQSNRLANALCSLGLEGLNGPGEVGNRIGILLPQCVETALCHIAIWKMGAVLPAVIHLVRRRCAGASAQGFRRAGVDHQRRRGA